MKITNGLLYHLKNSKATGPTWNLSTGVKKHTSKLIKFVLQILELGKFQIRDFPFC